MTLICLSVSVSILIIAYLMYLFFNKDRGKILLKGEEDRLGFFERLYYIIFGKKQPEIIAKKIGINIDEYCKNCEVLNINPEFQKIIVLRILGVISAVLLAVLGAVTNNVQLIMTALIPFVALVIMPSADIKEKSNKKKAKIMEELPRFLDMLETALYIGLPIEEAIRLTSLHLKDTTLSKEFAETITEIQIGAVSWQNALLKMSNKYEIDIFAELVLDLVNAYEKGIAIYDTVCSENRSIKQARVLMLKESANKMHSTILFPIAIFKLVPIIILIGLPIVIQLLNSGF